MRADGGFLDIDIDLGFSMCLSKHPPPALLYEHFHYMPLSFGDWHVPYVADATCPLLPQDSDFEALPRWVQPPMVGAMRQDATCDLINGFALRCRP